MPWNSYARALPDFVILGVQHNDRDGGVTVIASSEVHEAELEVHQDYSEAWTSPYERFMIPTMRSITLTCHLREYVVISAPTYGEAFRKLFEDWTPKPKEHKALPEGRRGLPRG